MKTQKDYVIEALCDALDDCFEYQQIEGIDGYAIKYDGDLGDFNSNFILAILADDCDDDDCDDNDCDDDDCDDTELETDVDEWGCVRNIVQTFDLASYWDNPSEIMTMGEDILSDIADEIIECIENN